jgi:hypothetical protein
MEGPIRRVAVLLVSVVLMAGCQVFVVRERAPEAFRSRACHAHEDLTMAAAAVTLGEYPDLSARMLTEGIDWLVGVPGWGPGAAFVTKLRGLARALSLGESHVDALSLVDAEYRRLYDTHGFTCDWVFSRTPLPS